MHRFAYTLYPAFLISVCVFYGGYAQTANNSTETSTADSVTSTVINPTTGTPITCEVHNNDCKACVAQSQCYYCDENNQCHAHINNVIADGQCDVSKTHFWTCKVSFKVLMIIAGSLIGLALLIILIVCCCCCCKKKGIKISKDDLKWARQREERKQIADERRKERAERTEEIRKKYGLVKDSNPYERFDA